ncbi:reverse transcriptase domain-containing protein [Tanacetum coccineum]
MSRTTELNLTPPTFTVRNTMGREKEQTSKNPYRPASDAALREYCDKHYHQLLPIIAEKVYNEKVQQEKLKQVKARLNFEGCSGRNSKIQETSQYSESRTPNKRGDLRKRLKPRRPRSMSKSPERTSVFSEIQRDRSTSPRRRQGDKRRREGDVFHRLGVEEEVCPHTQKAVTRIPVHEERRPSQKVKIVKEDIGSQGRENRSQASKRKIYLNHGHVRKQIPSPHESATSNSQKRAAAKVERWAMPTWCHMFNSILTGSTRVWFDDLPPESIDSYDDLKKAFLANYLQQKKCIKDSVEIHHIKQREGESMKDFVQRRDDERNHSVPPRRGGGLQSSTEESTSDMEVAGKILALDKGKFKSPLLMTTPVEKRNNNKFCEFHREVGHNTDECMHLKRKIEELIKNGKLSHVIKEHKQGDEDETEGPMIIEAEIGGHFIHRIYVDGGSASDILYEHCFNRLRPEVKNQMIPATAPLIGFSREIIWPMGQILLPVKIGDVEHFTSTWMNFVVVRSPSPYNGIIGRPGVRKI